MPIFLKIFVKFRIFFFLILDEFNFKEETFEIFIRIALETEHPFFENIQNFFNFYLK